MCDISYFFVVHLIPEKHLIAIMIISVEFCSFVSRLVWTSIFSILVNGHIHTSYYPELGKRHRFDIQCNSVINSIINVV